MQVGIGLTNAVRGVDRDAIVQWAQRAERAGFASLGTIDRVVYPSYESLIALAAAAAVTERIRLVTDILIAPLRSNTALLAKQAATVDQISEGRLTLGLAVGGRQDDYEASGVPFHQRGGLFDEQLRELTRIWGESRGGAGAVGPPPARGESVELLIGGTSDAALRRAARFARGWTQGGGTPQALGEVSEKLKQHWRDAAREDEPYKVALFYFALGDDAGQKAERGVGHYYEFLGEYRDQVVASVATSPEMIQSYLTGFEEAGADEVICFPSSDLDDVERLAQAAL